MATSDFLINKEYFHKHLLFELNAGMRKAAEPVIEQAMQDIEREMKKKLGSMLVAFLDSYVEIDREGSALRIIVKHDPN